MCRCRPHLVEHSGGYLEAGARRRGGVGAHRLPPPRSCEIHRQVPIARQRAAASGGAGSRVPLGDPASSRGGCRGVGGVLPIELGKAVAQRVRRVAAHPPGGRSRAPGADPSAGIAKPRPWLEEGRWPMRPPQRDPSAHGRAPHGPEARPARRGRAGGAVRAVRGRRGRENNRPNVARRPRDITSALAIVGYHRQAVPHRRRQRRRSTNRAHVSSISPLAGAESSPRGLSQRPFVVLRHRRQRAGMPICAPVSRRVG